MKRYDCCKILAELIDPSDLVVTNMGGVACEWHYLRPAPENFLMWHSLGLASSIGLGMAQALPHRRVIVLDGDGGLLMNLGTLSTIARAQVKNLIVIGFDNQAYESPGGQPTATAAGADLGGIAASSGIPFVRSAETLEEFRSTAVETLKATGPSFLHAVVELGAAPVPLPTMDALENKYQFIRQIEATEKIQIMLAPGHVSKMRSTE